MPDNSYTSISEAWHTTSWLDYCICTAHAHDSLNAMEINYNLATTYHIPFSILLNVGKLPMLMAEDSHISASLSKEDLML